MTASPSPHRAIEAIDEAYAKATPGEWRPQGECAYGVDIYTGDTWLGNTMNSHEGKYGFPPDAHARTNADFIATAHNNWPAARAHISTLEEQVARLSQQAELWKDIVRDEIAETLRMVDALGIDRDSLGERPLAAVMLERVAALRAAAALASGGQDAKAGGA